MPDNTQISQEGLTNYVRGLLTNETNLNNDNLAADNHIGAVVAAITGSLDMLPAYNGAAFSTPGISGNLSISIGGPASDGAPQALYVQGRYCDYLPVTTFLVTALSGGSSPRVDLIAVQFTSVSISGLIPEQYIQNIAGVNTLSPVGINYNSVTWNYVQGVPGGGVPATPLGYEAFATVLMSGGQVTTGPGCITYLFKSGIAATNNAPNTVGTSALMNACGLVLGRVRASQATATFITPHLSGGTSNGAAPVLSYLGGLQLPPVFGGNSAQGEYALSVAPGAGPQSLSGTLSSYTSGGPLFAANSGSNVWLDGIQVAFRADGGGFLDFPFTVVIPDDGKRHILVLNVNNNSTLSPVNCIQGTVGPFLPANAAGGLDTTKIAYCTFTTQAGT